MKRDDSSGHQRPAHVAETGQRPCEQPGTWRRESCEPTRADTYKPRSHRRTVPSIGTIRSNQSPKKPLERLAFGWVISRITRLPPGYEHAVHLR